MSKLRCHCGHTIADQTDNISYKASFRRDKDDESFFAVAGDIAAFVKAIEIGERDEWIKKYFTDEYLGINPSNFVVIQDIISKWDFDHRRTMYQCEKCGRVAIQKNDSNIFAFFKQEDKVSNGIFDVE